MFSLIRKSPKMLKFVTFQRPWRIKETCLQINQCNNYSLYEPDYLDVGKSKLPVYDKLNIQIKGYDFSVLESYHRVVYKIVNHIGLDVEDGWAAPAQNLLIKRFKPESTVSDAEFKLNIYERNLQVSTVESTTVPILLEVLSAALPEGVTLQIHEHIPEYEEIRYVPDNDLLALRSQLESMFIKK